MQIPTPQPSPNPKALRFSMRPVDEPCQDFFDENHKRAIELGQEFYIDKATGFQVWTELYHLKRGTCCESACRHCPYGFGES